MVLVDRSSIARRCCTCSRNTSSRRAGSSPIRSRVTGVRSTRGASKCMRQSLRASRSCVKTFAPLVKRARGGVIRTASIGPATATRAQAVGGL
jgi:hypothetical protein